MGPSNWSPFIFFFISLLIASIILSNPLNQVEAKCQFPAIFNFGDSNSDTGGFYAAFPAQHEPFGMTFFHYPTGRAADGCLIIDFFAKSLGLPFLSPYLQSIGPDFRHGANFATLASTVLLPKTSLFVTGISPFSLAIQLAQMQDLKAKSLNRKQSGLPLPSPDVFDSALYTLDIGQNDFTSNLQGIGTIEFKQSLSLVVNQISSTIKELYDLGGRNFIVFNLAPVGCYPAFLAQTPHSPRDLDKYGCMVSFDKDVVYYNKLLLKSLKNIRGGLQGANVVYFDKHAVLLELYRQPQTHGFNYTTKSCCGYGDGPYNFDPSIYCGNTKLIDGRDVTASACADPQNYVSWDGIHSTESANKIVALALIDGSKSHPPFPLSKFCDLNPID